MTKPALLAGLGLTTLAAAAEDTFAGHAPKAALPQVEAGGASLPRALASAIAAPRSGRAMFGPSSEHWHVQATLELAAWTGLVVALSRPNPRLRPLRAAAYCTLGVALLVTMRISLKQSLAPEAERNLAREVANLPLIFRDVVYTTMARLAIYGPIAAGVAVLLLEASRSARATPGVGQLQAPAKAAAPELDEVHSLLPAFGDESKELDVSRVREGLGEWTL